MKPFNKKILLPILMAAGVLGTSAAQSAIVEIDWEDPESYTDVESNTYTGDRKFRQQIVDELGAYFKESANEHLRTEQTLRINVHDVDLAGEVEYFFTRFDNQGVRVLRDVYFPSIDFSYELLNQDGVSIEAGRQNVRDIGYRFAGARTVARASRNYEKELIDDWFESTFD